MRDYSGLYGADNELALYGSANEEAGYGHVTDQLNDLRRAALYALGIPLGQNNDMVLTWLHMNGATSDDLNDAWREMLNAQLDESLRTGQLNDDWYTLLGTLGFTGTINDREYGFWYAGGEFGDTSPTWFGLSATYYVYEIGDGLTIQLSEHCYGRPPEITYTSTVPTCDPNTGELVITWADIGSAPGANAVTVTATNTAGMGQTSFTVIGVAGEQDLPPQLVAGGVPDVFSTFGQIGVDPSIRAQSGLPMQDYFTSTTTPEYVPPGSVPPAFEMVPSSVAQIDPDTGVMTGKPSAAVNDYNLQAFARNSVGQSPTNWFLWQVLPVGGWVVDFTSVDPDTLGGLTYASTSETFNDYIAEPQTVGPDVPAMVGQQWDNPGYTQRGVSYGAQIEALTTAVDGSFDTLAGVPNGGLVNNYTMRASFRISKSLADIWADNAGEWGHALEVFHNDDNINAVQILQTSATNLTARLKTDDNTNDRMLVFTVGAVPAGTLFDFRLRKSDTDDNGDNGWWGQCRVDGGVPIEVSAVNDCTAPHALGPLNRVSIGSPANNDPTQRIPGDYQYIQIEARALDKATIEGWPSWEEPTPVLIDVNPPFLHFGEGDAPPPTNPINEFNEVPNLWACWNIDGEVIPTKSQASPMATVEFDPVTNTLISAKTMYGDDPADSLLLPFGTGSVMHDNFGVSLENMRALRIGSSTGINAGVRYTYPTPRSINDGITVICVENRDYATDTGCSFQLEGDDRAPFITVVGDSSEYGVIVEDGIVQSTGVAIEPTSTQVIALVVSGTSSAKISINAAGWANALTVSTSLQRIERISVMNKGANASTDSMVGNNSLTLVYHRALSLQEIGVIYDCAREKLKNGWCADWS